MKFTSATLLVAAFASIALPAAFASCNTQPYGACGSSKTGASCCPDSFYCQPWDAGYYQCMPQPEKCAKQRTNIDYPGNDLETLFGIQPGDCCKRCAQTPGCVGYTFVNSRPGQPACYLKKALGHEREMAGAVSGVLNGVVPTAKPTPTAPNGRCTTAAYGNCGNSHGASCCPKGQYCQPWSPQYYQCMDAPAGCTSQLTDTDYPGNDLKKLALGSPGECCKACKDDKHCKAYTFINYSANGPACFLKTAAGSSKRLVGAVSAKL